MSSRRDVFFNGGVFHIFNRTIEKRKLFIEPSLNERFITLFHYYRSLKAELRYSKFVDLPVDLKKVVEERINNPNYYKIEILSYCLMPTHFHLLVKQKATLGVIRFLSDIVNSITRYFNILHERQGPLFLPQFKSRRIITREDLIHVSRYIHLNPYSATIVKTKEELVGYRWSSFSEYFRGKGALCEIAGILDEFKGDREKYSEFVLGNREYQKTLEAVKYSQSWL